MAEQIDLKTSMGFSGYTQVSTVIGNYVFATSESMKSAVNGMDQLRPTLAKQSLFRDLFFVFQDEGSKNFYLRSVLSQPK
jgi:hypothetical protein